MNDKKALNNALGTDLVKIAQTEAGLEAAYKLILENKTKEFIPTDEIVRVIEEANTQFLHELRDEGLEMEASNDSDDENVMLTLDDGTDECVENVAETGKISEDEVMNDEERSKLGMSDDTLEEDTVGKVNAHGKRMAL